MLKRFQGFPSKKGEVGPAPDLQMTVALIVVVVERDISGVNMAIWIIG
jgi:hypothetical protein